MAQLSTTAQHQTVVDAPYLEESVIGVLPAPEGGTYAAGQIPADGTLTTFRFNNDGTLAWERVLVQLPTDIPNDFVNAESLIPALEDGVVVNGYGTPSHTDHSGPMLDTTTVRHVFTEISAQGEISSMWTLTRVMVDDSPIMPPVDFRRAVTDPTGGYFLLIDYNGPESLELLRLTASGELLWARSIGRPDSTSYWADIFPTVGETPSVQTMNAAQLLCSASGDVYIVNCTQNPYGALKVKKVTPTGELAWVRTYEFIGIDPGTARCMAATLDGAGNLHVLYKHGYPNTVHTAMRIGPDGELLSVDAFDLNMGSAYRMMVGDNGDRFIGVQTNFQNDNALFHLATGGVLQRTVRSTEVQDPYLLYTTALAWDLTNDRIRMGGRIDREHQIFSTTLRYPLVVNLPAQDFALCEGFNTTGTYVSMPLENLNVAVSTEDISVDITDQWSSSASELYTNTEPVPYGLFDLCGLALGVTAEGHESAQHHVRPNLLTSGEPISVDVTVPTRLDIMTVDGRGIATTYSTIGMNTISTSSCAPGIYLVRASGMDGQLSWCERVTVQ